MSDPTKTNPQAQSPADAAQSAAAGAAGAAANTGAVEKPADPGTADAAKSAAADTAGTAADKSKEVAGAATDQAKEVASHAREQITSVTGEARSQAQKVMSTASSDLETQLEDRLTRAAEAARSTADQLMALAEGRTEDAGRAGDLARQASERLEHLAGRADELGPRGVVEELSDFARRRPGAFLLGAVAAGVLAGRLARAGKEVQSASSSESSTSGAADLSGSSTPALTPGGGTSMPGLGGQTAATPSTPPADGSVAGAGSTPGGYTSPGAPGGLI